MKRYVGGGIKDETGAYIPAPPRKVEQAPVTFQVPEPGSLDEIGEVIIIALSRAVKKLTEKIVADDVSREVIGALKDCESMHRELSKKEKEFLANLSDADLETLANSQFVSPPHETI
jgi:hypothetical protein